MASLLMAPIRSLLSFASRRLAAGRLLRAAAWAITGAATLVLLLVLLERSSPAVALPWKILLIALGSAVAIVAVLWMRSTRPSEVELAVLVDERLDLKERISTALAVRDRSDPFARAACEDAVRIASDRAVRERAGRAFPVRAGRETSWAVGAVALAAAAYVLIPQGDLFRRDRQPDDVALAAVRAETDAAMAEILRKVEENPALAAELRQKGEIGDAAPRPDERMADPKATPEEARREAIRRMNELQRKLEEIAKGEQAMATEALRQQLAKLEAMDDADTKELADALQKGDFAAAKAALEKMREEAARKGDAEKQELEKKLNQLAEQVGQLAANREQVEEALRKAGLDPAAAGNPEALKQAIENAKNLTESQKEQLKKAIQSQESAQKKLKELEQGLKQCANGMCQGGQQGGGGQKQGSQGQQGEQGGQQPGQPGQQGGEGAGGMEAMLSELETAQQMADAAEAAANEAESQCQGMGEGLGQMAGASKGDSDSDQVSMIDGIRQGGRGRAAGGKTPTAPTPTGTKLVKEKTKLQKGDIIARQLVEGEVEIGESTIPVAPAEGEIDASVEGGVNEDRVPTHLKDVHKHYFGELKKRIEAKQKAASP